MKITGFVLLGACTACAILFGNIYEGVQMQQRQAEPPGIDSGDSAPSYEEYLRQRREVAEKEPLALPPQPEVVKP